MADGRRVHRCLSGDTVGPVMHNDGEQWRPPGQSVSDTQLWGSNEAQIVAGDRKPQRMVASCSVPAVGTHRDRQAEIMGSHRGW